MKRNWLFLIVVALIFSNSIAQNKKSNQKRENAPKEDVRVNKEYDEAGNLIRYDSTYTYYYSNIDNHSLNEDSIFNDFKMMFDQSNPFTSIPSFHDLFFQDSLMKYDFFKDDFFTERYRRNMEYSQRMFLEMDSLKNKFFKEQSWEK